VWVIYLSRLQVQNSQWINHKLPLARFFASFSGCGADREVTHSSRLQQGNTAWLSFLQLWWCHADHMLKAGGATECKNLAWCLKKKGSGCCSATLFAFRDCWGIRGINCSFFSFFRGFFCWSIGRRGTRTITWLACIAITVPASAF